MDYKYFDQLSYPVVELLPHYRVQYIIFTAHVEIASEKNAPLSKNVTKTSCQREPPLKMFRIWYYCKSRPYLTECAWIFKYQAQGELTRQVEYHFWWSISQWQLSACADATC